MFRKKLIGGIMLAPLAFMLFSFEGLALENISGSVFNDSNLNGVFDNGESGIGDIQVSIYNAGGLVAETTSDLNGSYTFNVEAGDYRLQIEDFAAMGYAPSVDNGSSSSVRFLTTSENVQDFGLHIPSDFCGNNPDIAITCFVAGKQTDDGRLTNDPALVDIDGSAGESSLTPDAATIASYSNPTAHDLMVPASEIGSTYGLAHDPSSNSIYVSAFMKRHTGFGPGGTGAIYKVDRDSGTASVLTSLNAGVDTHPTSQFENEDGLCIVDGQAAYNPESTEDCWLHDPYSFDQVGLSGLGDLEISTDLNTLYTVNLFDQQLYAIDVVSGETISTTAIPDNCGASSGAAFGLGSQPGSLFVGTTCQDGSTAQVYKFDTSTGLFETNAVLQFGLSYERGSVANWFVPPMSANWNAWVNDWNEVELELAQGNDSDVSVASKPQALLSDIEFDENGNMLIGLRDRFGDQAGHAFSTDTSNPTIYESEAAGDILKACGDQGSTWIIEGSDDSCPTNTGSDGVNEFFVGDNYVDGQQRTTHAELGLGSLAYDQNRESLISSVYNPIPFYYEDGETDTYRDQGLRWFNTETGQWEQSYRLVDGTRSFDFFDKANGLGDIELLCSAAPIEIGNRVWFDNDRDGEQDPADPALTGITVELLNKDGELVATATTNENGHYLFSSGVGEDSTSTLYNLDLGLRTDYSIRIDTTQEALNGYAPTLSDASDEGIDSDGIPNGSFVTTAFTTGASGANNHSFDFGFTTGAFGSAGPVIDPESGDEIVCDDILEDALNNDTGVDVPEVCLPFGATGGNPSVPQDTASEGLIRTGGR